MKVILKINPLIALVWKDLKLVLFSLSGWLMLIVFDGVILWLFLQNFFLIGQVELNYLFSLLLWGWLVLAAALSSRSFNQERDNRTLELLFSLPITNWQLVLAKFLAGLVVFFFILLSFLPPLVIIYGLGGFDLGQLISAWIGSGLLFSFFLSYALFTSLYFSNLVVVFLFNLFSLFLIYLGGSELVLNRLPSSLSKIGGAFSLPIAWRSFLIGVPSLAAVVFLSSGVLLFLSLAIIKLSRMQPR